MEQNKVRRTQNFYDKYPLSDGQFRSGNSLLRAEDIQINLKELEGKKVLDAGCGTGNNSISLLNNVKDIKLTCFDISKESLKVLEEKVKKGKGKNLPSLLLGDVLSLPSKFEKNYFDFIICAGVAHHTPEPFKVLENLNYILKRGGRMYFSMYNKKNFYFLEFHTIGRFFRLVNKFNFFRLLSFFIALFRIELTILSKEKISFKHAEKIFADRYLTPTAQFHTKKEIKKWCKHRNFKILRNGTLKLGNLNWFLVEKR